MIFYFIFISFTADDNHSLIVATVATHSIILSTVHFTFSQHSLNFNGDGVTNLVDVNGCNVIVMEENIAKVLVAENSKSKVKGF